MSGPTPGRHTTARRDGMSSDVDETMMPDPGQDALLVVERDATARQNARAAYVVEIDDQSAGHIRRGEQCTIRVSPGSHRIAVTISRVYRSPTLLIDCAPQQTVRLRCGPKRKRFVVQS